MTDELPLTRRRVLAGLAGAGTLGGTAGAYTAATFGDRELIPVGMTAGSAGIDVHCSDAGCEVADGVVSFAIADISPGETGQRSFTISVVDNPVRVWLRTDCPTKSDGSKDDSHDEWPGKHGDRPGTRSGNATSTGDAQGGGSPGWGDPGGWPPKWDPRPDEPLQDALKVRLSIDEGCDGDSDRLFPEGGDSWGTLRDLKTALADGTRLDAAEQCFSSSRDACLLLDYWLPKDVHVDGGSSVGLDLELYAEQCRHRSEGSVESPFDANRCEQTGCPECVDLGKLEGENVRLEPSTTHQFTELYDPFAGDGHEYELEVLDVTTKDDEGGGHGETTCVEFRLLRDGEETVEMCAVEVKGGPESRTYEIEPPGTRTPGKLCTPDRDDHPGRTGGGAPNRPEISYIVVSVCDSAGNGGDGK